MVAYVSLRYTVVEPTPSNPERRRMRTACLRVRDQNHQDQLVQDYMVFLTRTLPFGMMPMLKDVVPLHGTLEPC